MAKTPWYMSIVALHETVKLQQKIYLSNLFNEWKNEIIFNFLILFEFTSLLSLYDYFPTDIINFINFKFIDLSTIPNCGINWKESTRSSKCKLFWYKDELFDREKCVHERKNKIDIFKPINPYIHCESDFPSNWCHNIFLRNDAKQCGKCKGNLCLECQKKEQMIEGIFYCRICFKLQQNIYL